MRGRPRLTDEAAAQEAVRIIRTAEVLWRFSPTSNEKAAAHVLKRQRESALKALGFATEAEAAAYVIKRRFGRVGEFVGDSVRDFFPTINRVQAAVSLVLDYGFKPYRAAKLTGATLTNIKHALPAGTAERATARERVRALNFQVTDDPPS